MEDEDSLGPQEQQHSDKKAVEDSTDLPKEDQQITLEINKVDINLKPKKVKEPKKRVKPSKKKVQKSKGKKKENKTKVVKKGRKSL